MTDPHTVLVAGASGFVGRRLCPALDEAGYDVRAMTRHPEEYRGAGKATYGDVHDPETLTDALSGADAAYYLVHSLASADFERLDAEAARAFGQAAAGAGRAADRLPRRPRQGPRRPVGAPAQPARGRGPARAPAGCRSPRCGRAS